MADNKKEGIQRERITEFPGHLYIPKDGLPIDDANIVQVDPSSRFTLIKFTAPLGAITRILGIVLFNTGLVAANFDFICTIDGRRAFPFLGSSVNNFRLFLGRTNDLGNAGLMNAYTEMQPGQVFQVDAINRELVVSATMGARMVGYVDKTNTRVQGRFG
jgi:hypothetical protein